jgi:GNAT superfamily N-acetyltransferase
MNIEILHVYPMEETMIFEEMYPDNLRLDLQGKLDLKEDGAEFIYIRDSGSGQLMGETYFISVNDLREELGLDEWKNKNAVYVYSTTILTDYRSKGVGKYLKQYFMNYISGRYSFVLGHARDNASIYINKGVGAEIIKDELNWQGIGETYYLYKIVL